MKYVLIKLPNWLGDAMMLTPTIECLIRLFPQVKLILVGNALSVSVFTTNDSIIQIFVDKTKQAKGILKRVRATTLLASEINDYLKAQNITLDCAITTQNNFFSALLLAKIATPMRIGYGDKNLFGMRKFLLTHLVQYKSGRHPSCTHQVLSYIQLLLPILPQNFFQERQVDSNNPHHNPAASTIQNILFQEAHNLHLYLPITTRKAAQPPIIALSTGASYGESKMWFAEYFAAIIADFAQHNYAVRLYGASNEVSRNQEIVQAAKNSLSPQYHDLISDLSGRTSIPELANSLAECSLYIGNDSGTTHIARALNIPSIILFGPMPFAWCSPWSDIPTKRDGIHHTTANTIAIQQDLPCVPCKQKTCPLKHHDCMRLITPEEVLRLSYSLLQKAQLGES